MGGGGVNHARIAQSELDIAEGRVYDFDDVMREPNALAAQVKE